MVAGLYALYSGLAVVPITGIAFAPPIHAFLYRLHLEAKADRDDARGAGRPAGDVAVGRHREKDFPT